MSLVTLEQALKHLRIASDDPYQAALYDDVQLKIDAASEIVLDFCGFDRDFFEDSSGDTIYDLVPKTLQAGVLVYVGIMFNNRDGESDESLNQLEIPRSVSNILSLYRKPGLA